MKKNGLTKTLLVLCLALISFFLITTSLNVVYAGLTLDYTVHYDSNGGSAVEDTIGSSLPSTLPTPTKANCLFDGWYYDNTTFENQANPEDSISNSLTIYAKWINVIKEEPSKDNDYTVVVDDSLNGLVTYKWLYKDAGVSTGDTVFSSSKGAYITQTKGTYENGVFTPTTELVHYGGDDPYDLYWNYIKFSYTTKRYYRATISFKSTCSSIKGTYSIFDKIDNGDGTYTYTKTFNSSSSQQSGSYELSYSSGTDGVHFTIYDFQIDYKCEEQFCSGAQLGNVARNAGYYCEVYKDGTQIASSQGVYTKTVSFYTNGAEQTTPGTVYQLEGRTVSISNGYTKNRETFIGWSDGTVTLPKEATSYTVGNSNVTLSIQWKHTHTLDKNEYAGLYSSFKGGVLTSGSYYIVEQLVLDYDIVIDEGETVFICLCDRYINLNGHRINNYGTLTILDCTNNYHRYEIENDVLVLSSVYTSNAFYHGFIIGSTAGAIYNANDLTLKNVSIVGNTNTDEGAGLINNGTATIDNCSFIGNKTDMDGGAIYNSGKLNIYNSLIKSNTAASNGGGICTSNKTYISNSTITYNKASHGAGIYVKNKVIALIGTTITNNSASVSGGGVELYYESCLAEGTKITTSDGTLKNIENIKVGDIVKTFNHETGLLEDQKVYYVFKSDLKGTAFRLTFETTTLDIVGEHDLFSQEEMKYVTIDTDNYSSYIGQHFYNASTGAFEELLSADSVSGKSYYYTIYTAKNFNCIANGMLSVSDDADYHLNIFEFDPNLKINQTKLNEDIATYGLLSFDNCTYVTQQEYDDYQVKYLPIIIGKGYKTYGELVGQAAEVRNGSYASYEEYPDGTIVIGSDTTIKNNLANGVANNLYLPFDAFHNDTPCNVIISKDATGIDVGITLGTEDNIGTFVKEAATKGYLFSFTSDLSGNSVKATYDEENKTYSYSLINHTHGNGTKVDGKPAGCLEDGWKDYYLCGCGEYYSDADCTNYISDLEAWKVGDGKLTKTGHTYSSTWTSDATKHWHAASCEHTTLKTGEANHTWNNGTCKVCSYACQHTGETGTDCSVCGKKLGYRITYYSLGGVNLSDTIAFAYPNPMPTTTKDGYVFQGWYESYNSSTNTYSSPVTPGESISSNKYIYAKWERYHVHNGINFNIELSGSIDSSLAEGNYILTNNISINPLTSNIEFSGNINICLNGYTINIVAGDGYYVLVSGNLAIYDCDDTESRTAGISMHYYSQAEGFRVTGSLTLNSTNLSGTVTDRKKTGLINVVGGTLTLENGVKFTNNTAKYLVELKDGATLNMSNTNIYNNGCDSIIYTSSVKSNINIGSNVIIDGNKKKGDASKTVGICLGNDTLLNVNDAGKTSSIVVDANVTGQGEYIFTTENTTDISSIFTLATGGYAASTDYHYVIRAFNNSGKYECHLSNQFTITYNYSTVEFGETAENTVSDSSYYFSGDKVTIVDGSGVSVSFTYSGHKLDAGKICIKFYDSDADKYYEFGEKVTLTKSITLKAVFVETSLYYNVSDGKFYYRYDGNYILEVNVNKYHTSSDFKTLYLEDGFSYETNYVPALAFKDAVNLVIEGNATLKTNYSEDGALYAEDKVTIGGTGVLSIYGGLYVDSDCMEGIVFDGPTVHIFSNNHTSGYNSDECTLDAYRISVKSGSVSLTLLNEDAEGLELCDYKGVYAYGKVNEEDELVPINNYCDEDDNPYTYILIVPYTLEKDGSAKDNFEIKGSEQSTYQWYIKEATSTDANDKNVEPMGYVIEGEDYKFTIEDEGGFSVKINCDYVIFNITAKIILNSGYAEYYGFTYELLEDNGTSYTYKANLVDFGDLMTYFEVEGEDGAVVSNIKLISSKTKIEGATSSTYVPTEEGIYFPEAQGSYATLTGAESKATKVSFDVNGGVGSIDPMYYFVGGKITLPTSGITRNGYTLIGWTLVKNSSDVITSYTITDENVVLYAAWSLDTIDVTINENPQTYTYGDSGVSFAIKNTTLTGFTVEYFVSGAYTTTVPTNVGKYNVKITRAAGDIYNAYAKVITDGLVINQKEIVINWTNATYTYNGAVQVVSASYKDINNQDVALTVTMSDVFKNAGNYTATASFANGETNYKLPTTVTKAYSIAKANYVMTNAKWNYTSAFTYDGQAKTVSVTGLPSGITASYTNNAKTDAGNYVASVSFTYDSANYNEPTLPNCTWVIGKAANEITLSATTLNITFGDTITFPTASSTFGEVTNDSASITDINNGGTHVVTYSVAGTSNYDGAQATFTITIAKAQTIITVSTNTISVLEGTTVVLPTATSNYGSVVCNKTATDLVNVGTYTVTYTVASTENYTDASAELTVIIKAKEVVTPTTEEETKPDVKVETETGFDPDVKVVVQVTVETEVETKINENVLHDYSVDLAKNEVVGVVFDVKLKRTVNGVETEIQPTDLDGVTSITVLMKLPEGLDLSKVTRILHVHGDGTIDEYDFDSSKVTEDGYYEISISKLSEFAFIYHKAGLSAGAIVAIVLLSLLLLLLIAYILGYFFCYRRGHLDDSPIKVIYVWLPRGNANKEKKEDSKPELEEKE